MYTFLLPNVYTHCRGARSKGHQGRTIPSWIRTPSQEGVHQRTDSAGALCGRASNGPQNYISVRHGYSILQEVAASRRRGDRRLQRCPRFHPREARLQRDRGERTYTLPPPSCTLNPYPYHPQYAGKFQKLSNNQILSKACKELNAWVRKGDINSRKQALQALQDPGDGEMSFLLVAALVKVSRGRGTIYPFGPDARKKTHAFKKVPTGLFGVVIANMWVFIKNTFDESAWKHLLSSKNKKNVFHPLTGLWPLGTMHRFNHFVKTARDKMPTLFATYEAEGGEYHGSDEPFVVPTEKNTSTSRKKRKRKEPTSLSAAIEEEEEDLEFVVHT